MRRMFWIMLATLLASSAAAQSLAEIAKKEKERRANNNAEQTRTITENDLLFNARGPLTTTSVVSATNEERSEDEGDAEPESGDAEPESEDAEPESEDARQTAEYWRDRLSSADQRIQTLQQQVQSPLYSPDWLQNLEQQLAQAQAERAAIVQEARRVGVPPGWLR